MTKDRTAELKRIREEALRSSGDNGNQGPSYDNVAIEMEHYDRLPDFLKQVEEVRQLIEGLKEQVINVRKFQSKILSSPVPDDDDKNGLDQLMSTIKKMSTTIRTKLKDIEKAVQKEAEDDDNNSASLRTRQNQYSALVRVFIDAINNYQQTQTDYRDQCKGRIKRQFEIAGNEFNDEQVEDMIESGNWNVFTQGIIQETEQARQMLADIEARHNDIINLEKSIKELHDLFIEMAVLVQNQGEIIDRIETHVIGARDYVEEAKVQLKAAVKHQSSARRKKIYIAIIVLIIILVVGLIIYFTI